MSRGFAIFCFWLLGFAIGFMGYLIFPNFSGWFQEVFPKFFDQTIIGALIAGIVGSAISTLSIVTWANREAY